MNLTPLIWNDRLKEELNKEYIRFLMSHGTMTKAEYAEVVSKREITDRLNHLTVSVTKITENEKTRKERRTRKDA